MRKGFNDDQPGQQVNLQKVMLQTKGLVVMSYQV